MNKKLMRFIQYHKVSSVISLCIMACLLVFIVLLGFNGMNGLKMIMGGTSTSAFSEYTYSEYHDNGSYTTVKICQYNGLYYMTQSYKSAGGQYSYKTEDLDKESVERWNKTISDFKVSSDAVDESSGSYVKASLKFKTGKGGSEYNVVPLDMSGFGVVNPWVDKNAMTMALGVSEISNKLYPLDDMNAFFDLENQQQLGACLEMVNSQIEKLLSTDNQDVFISDINSITLDNVTDNEADLVLTMSSKTYHFHLMKDGHLFFVK